MRERKNGSKKHTMLLELAVFPNALALTGQNVPNCSRDCARYLQTVYLRAYAFWPGDRAKVLTRA
jgi:hypothetical protein